MKLRSNLKIEALVLAAYPNSKPFRREGDEELFQRCSSASRSWEQYRDSICPATNRDGQCICYTDPRLKDHPLRQHFITILDESNRVDRVAYDKLVVARNNLRSMYHQVNELKTKVHNAPKFQCDEAKIKDFFKQHVHPIIYS
jgi:hypothetical protein